ncbi:tripartite ATP-independent transporter solute receptor, DctP family [Fulvimarina manganoxydans]|uniref:Tripartite ATP-independent transporter solute receptor, DctP family n=1 Tax=Fulvimarina manganoxydans TaxID=937218 RepID=A0A1W1ZDE1_9HYPH|nr:TRAP transporter substrate-binding protein [Fulvimarina manganoxydans]MCK5932740.1 TRAP transporter substrate-binding protein [Fulvimarina manganoxydans]MEE2950462.1 TRAP transporter substrate-binding protein [Pseudomonadota bacterium]SMC46460.1 tripartite ATP-independent transporter solute receptor, DctP family [Fulvimarina manganoxydans]
MLTRTLLATAAIVATLATANAETLRMGHIQAPGSPAAEGAKKFAELASQYSDGDLTIRVYPSAQLGDVRSLVGSVKTGAIDIAEGTFPLLADIVPEYNVYNAGYYYESWPQLNAVMEADEFGRSWDEQLTELSGIRVLGAFYYGSRNLTTNGLPAKSPADLQGKKIRSVPNEMSLAVVRGLGAQPTPVPFSELFQALSQGVVDGQENPLPTIEAEKLYEVQDHLILTNHQLITLPWIVNERRFQALSEDNQDALLRAASEAAEWTSQQTVTAEDGLVDKLSEQGMQVVAAEDGLDLDSFRSSVQAEVEKTFEGKIWPAGLGQKVLEKARSAAMAEAGQ